ncbi:sugar ABC transporter ATP-binding protein [Arthrobacter sp. I2-34]|uniref:Sugar ABC transporter ATP-binding protein n=1 Tax=Arthrobacter hankyongi TaxID=2904801 RepID=A0ABS9L8F9_9MICC|nr:sugar ABC transporter ATP-binding protein [Arthrobacter hankyongi]MCG2622961.1 sugar ABC transporter ATP-binding protein [Arthrobacter hankyongi]
MNQVTHPALHLEGVHKRFGGTHAVRDVELSLRHGRIHALLGENGAGKSTLVNMMSGMIEPDEGTIMVDGRPARFRTPADAQREGIRTVHQELELAPTLTVAENVLMGQLPRRFGIVDSAKAMRQAGAVLSELGAGIDPEAIVGSLPLAEQQLVEIARGLAARPKVLFLDEPTAALTPPEADGLLERLRGLAAQGVAILYISHHLEEVLAVADDVTVLRDGAVVLATEVSDTDRPSIVRAMLGADPLGSQARPAPAAGKGTSVFEVQDLRSGRSLGGVSFRVAAGEIVGFFGLAGSGHETIADCLYGSEEHTAGHATFCGEPLPASPIEARQRGIGYVPADRKGAGLALGLSVRDNILLANWSRLARAGIRRQGMETERAARLASRHAVKAGSLEAQVSSLSGGNQQKVVLARQFSGGETPRALLLSEPTRGVDIGAKAEIHRLMGEYVDAGGTCLVTSSDAEEVAALCDRVYVLSRGRILTQLDSNALTASDLTAAAL